MIPRSKKFYRALATGERKPYAYYKIKVKNNSDNSLVYNEEGEFIGHMQNNFGAANLGEKFTIEAVVKPGAEQVPYAAIIGNHGGFKGFVLQQDYRDKNFYRFVYGYGVAWLPRVPISLDADAWNYIAITIDSGTINAYKNGELVDTVHVQGQIRNPDAPLYIGNWAAKDRPFNGKIDEIAISKDALRDAEIKDGWMRVQTIIK